MIGDCLKQSQPHRKIGVLLLRSTEDITGPETFILSLLANINRKKYDVHLALLVKTKDRRVRLLEELKKNGIADHSIEIIHSPGKIQYTTIRTVHSILRTQRLDILHTNEHKSDVVGLIAAKLAGVGTVSSVHGWLSNSVRTKTYEAVDRLVVKFFDKIIVGSTALKNDLVKNGIKSDKITVVHNAVRLEAFHESNVDPAIKQRLGLHPQSPVIGVVGRLSKEKGHQYILRAMCHVIRVFPAARLLVVGRGSAKPQLERLAKHLGIAGHVIFTGFYNDIRSVFQIIDVFVLASVRESLPMVVLEAMAAGKPVVATSVGGVSELVRHGQTGLLVKPKDSRSIAEAVISLLKEEQKRVAMGRKGRERIRASFSAPLLARKVEHVYNELFALKNVRAPAYACPRRFPCRTR
jgi:glycosyltransferase involved in cell wall biosynthesis